MALRRWKSPLFALTLAWGSFASVEPVSAALYQPPEPYGMWDTWLLPNGSEYHLFFMQTDSGQPANEWSTLGRAVSTDLVHWQPLPPLPVKGPPGAWDHYPVMTGTTVKVGDRFALFYNSHKDNCQMGVMFSPDLKTWTKAHENPVLVSKGPYYGGKDWRDISVYHDKEQDLWHGYLCAQTAGEKPAACIGHVTSKDLIHWDYLPPVFTSADFIEMEVPDYFELAGHHYLIFSSVRSRKDTSGRQKASGCWYVMSERRDGPYRLPDRPLLLGAGQGRFDNYVARTIPFGDTRMLYQQTVGGPTVWGTVKLVRQHPDGTLWLQYWPGLDQLKRRDLNLTGMKAGNNASADSTGLQEVARTKAGADWLPVSVENVMITAEIDLSKAKRAGLVWRWNGTRGVGAILDRSANTASVVTVVPADDGQTANPSTADLTTKLVDDIVGIPLTDAPVHLRVYVRAHRAEVYLNDCWLFGVSTPDIMGEGKIGLFAEEGTATFKNLRAQELEPLVRASAQ